MFQKLAEGNVYTVPAQSMTCSGSRSARLPDGKYICTFNTESASGVNDFVPMAAYSDDGLHWKEAAPLWPAWSDKVSMFISVRNTDDGRICVCGMAVDIAYPGENWWSDELSAMKENRLVYAISDDGYDFGEPQFVDLPYYGACEIPGGMYVDANGVMYIAYAPYPTIEGREKVDTNCIVLMRSSDNGKTWESSKIGRVEGECLYAETWIGRLTTGGMLISTWQTAHPEVSDQYLYSKDGKNFAGPFPLPFRGQSTALTAIDDGKVLIVYNQRKESPAGVWLALAKPDEKGFNMLENQPAWCATTTTRSGSSGDFSAWTDFSFGEPHILEMADGTFLLTLWFAQNGETGIRYVHLAFEE